MAMPHRILNEDDKQKMFEDYKISDPANQLPYIDSQDTMVKWVGAIPGDVIEVLRHSDSAGRSLYYRYCVEDVSVTQ
jgi:DNA-directed RNA polymerase subunit H